MRIAMIAPPWITLPPQGYGGVEAVIHAQLPEFIRQGHDVTCFTVGSSTVPPEVDMHWYYEDGLYNHITRPLNEAIGIIGAHVLYALNIIRQDGGFDIIHDNTGSVAQLLAFAQMRPDLPPVLHTFHGPLTLENDEFGVGAVEQALTFGDSLYVNGISHTQLNTAPERLRQLLRKRAVGVVPNPVLVDDNPLPERKGDYFTMVARICRDKAQHLGIEYAKRLGVPLILAGPVESEPYFTELIKPQIDGRRVQYIPSVAGQEKYELLAGARGFLSPHQWQEPFGMAPLEANAAGTGVIATALGALTETIEHGTNGFLASHRRGDEFVRLMSRSDELDPAACREHIRENFSPEENVRQYVRLYQDVINRVEAARYGTGVVS